MKSFIISIFRNNKKAPENQKTMKILTTKYYKRLMKRKCVCVCVCFSKIHKYQLLKSNLVIQRYSLGINGRPNTVTEESLMRVLKAKVWTQLGNLPGWEESGRAVPESFIMQGPQGPGREQSLPKRL
jgi:hypothetical protein